MSEKPWWRDPRRLPPRAEAARAQVLSPGRVRTVRIVLVMSVVAGIAAIALGYVGAGLVMASAAFWQPLFWTAEQRRQVFRRG